MSKHSQKHQLLNELAIEFIDYSLESDFISYMIDRRYPDVAMIRSEMLTILSPETEFVIDYTNYEEFLYFSRDSLGFDENEIFKYVDLTKDLRIAFGLMKLCKNDNICENDDLPENDNFPENQDEEDQTSSHEEEDCWKNVGSSRVKRNSISDEKCAKNITEMSTIMNDVRLRRSTIHDELKQLGFKIAGVDSKKSPNLKAALNERKLELHNKLYDINGEVKQLFKNYSFPENIVDLHFLTIPEAQELLPVALRTIIQRKNSTKIVQIKIITGHNNNGSKLREWTKSFLNKLSVKYEMEGPGAFFCNFISNKQYCF